MCPFSAPSLIFKKKKEVVGRNDSKRGRMVRKEDRYGERGGCREGSAGGVTCNM